MGGAERGIAAHLGGDGMPQAADRRDVLAGRGLGQLPVEMLLALPLRRYAAGGYLQGRRPEMPHQVLALGGDVAVVEIDQHHLRLHDVFGPRFAWRRHRSRHDEKRHAGLGRPVSLNGKSRHEIGVRREEWRMRRPIGGSLLPQGPHRHEALAVAEHHLGEGSDGDGVRHDRRGVGFGRHHDQHRCFQAQ